MATRLEKDFRAVTGEDLDDECMDDAERAGLRLLILLVDQVRLIRHAVERIEAAGDA